MTTLVGTLGCIGGGQMAEALIRGLLSAQLVAPEALYVEGIRVMCSLSFY